MILFTIFGLICFLAVLDLTCSKEYNFAIDITSGGSVSAFQCIYQLGYNVVFAEAYNPTNGGTLNPSLIQNMRNAAAAGLSMETYVSPVTSGKTGAEQFDATYNYLKASGFSVENIWLKVTLPINWSSNVQSNIALIQSFVDSAKSKDVFVGIFTNWYDWQQITGSYTGFSNLRLWYWNQGASVESVASFDDFVSFGGWAEPALKQFAFNQLLCELTVNRDVYPAKKI